MKRKHTGYGALKTAGTSLGIKVRSTAKADAGDGAVRKAVGKMAADHILSAPKGARTLTHRRIKQAVEKVFEERYGTDA